MGFFEKMGRKAHKEEQQEEKELINAMLTDYEKILVGKSVLPSVLFGTTNKAFIIKLMKAADIDESKADEVLQTYFSQEYSKNIGFETKPIDRYRLNRAGWLLARETQSETARKTSREVFAKIYKCFLVHRRPMPVNRETVAQALIDAKYKVDDFKQVERTLANLSIIGYTSFHEVNSIQGHIYEISDRGLTYLTHNLPRETRVKILPEDYALTPEEKAEVLSKIAESAEKRKDNQHQLNF